MESRLSFAQISSIQKWSTGPETGIKDGFKEMKHAPCTFQLDFPENFWIMVNNLTVLYIPVTSSRSSSCFNTAVSTEEAGVRVLAVGGETDVFVVVLIGEG